MAISFDIEKFISDYRVDDGWIPVEDRLPTEAEQVLVSILDDSGDTAFAYTTVGWYARGMWVVDNEPSSFVSAWMPMPAPYRKKRMGF